MFTNVVVALKPGLPIQPLLDLAKAAAAPSARLHLVSRVQVGDGQELEHLESVRSALESAAAELEGEGYAASIEVGPVAVAVAGDINKAIENREADLAVIGLAKRSRVSKLLLGSTAQKVIMEAACPVLSTRFGPDVATP